MSDAVPTVSPDVIADMRQLWTLAHDQSLTSIERNQHALKFVDMTVANGGLLFAKAERTEKMEKLVPRMIEATPQMPPVPDEYVNGFRDGWIKACEYLVMHGWK